MPDRFKNRFYAIERIGRKDDRLCYITNEDGTLFLETTRQRLDRRICQSGTFTGVTTSASDTCPQRASRIWFTFPAGSPTIF